MRCDQKTQKAGSFGLAAVDAGSHENKASGCHRDGGGVVTEVLDSARNRAFKNRFFVTGALLKNP